MVVVVIGVWKARCRLDSFSSQSVTEFRSLSIPAASPSFFVALRPLLLVLVPVLGLLGLLGLGLASLQAGSSVYVLCGLARQVRQRSAYRRTWSAQGASRFVVPLCQGRFRFGRPCCLMQLSLPYSSAHLTVMLCVLAPAA